MDREYPVTVGDHETYINIRQVNSSTWVASAVRPDGEVVEVSSADADFAVESVRQLLQASDQTEEDPV